MYCGEPSESRSASRSRRSQSGTHDMWGKGCRDCAASHGRAARELSMISMSRTCWTRRCRLARSSKRTEVCAASPPRRTSARTWRTGCSVQLALLHIAHAASSCGTIRPSSKWCATSLTYSSLHPITRWCCVSTRRVRFKPWSAHSPCCPRDSAMSKASPTAMSSRHNHAVRCTRSGQWPGHLTCASAASTPGVLDFLLQIDNRRRRS